MGKGVDRHLFALDKWCERTGEGAQAIFNDKGWATMKDIRLSTSTLASPALDGGGFGPVSRTSYGVGYGIESRGAQFHVTSYGQGNEEFIQAIESSMADVQATIAAVSEPRRS
jgi:carnitine O-palmitoyltransferase 2